MSFSKKFRGDNIVCEAVHYLKFTFNFQEIVEIYMYLNKFCKVVDMGVLEIKDSRK